MRLLKRAFGSFASGLPEAHGTSERSPLCGALDTQCDGTDDDATMQPVSYADFRCARRVDRYLRRRWCYFGKAIEMARRLRPRRVLEIGPWSFPLFPAGDTLDMRDDYHPTYQHDAGATPWPVPTKAYDLIIALQVWEHLEGRQQAAFEELRRCARYAILSVPYLWKLHPGHSHAGIDDARMFEWTDGFKPAEQILVARPRRRRRKIYLFDFTTASQSRAESEASPRPSKDAA